MPDARPSSGPAASSRPGRQKSPSRPSSSSNSTSAGPASRQQGAIMSTQSSNGSFRSARSTASPAATNGPDEKLPPRSSKDSLKLKSKPDASKTKPPNPKMASDTSLATAKDELVKGLRTELDTLKSDFEGLRGLITCKICTRLLYEPYVTSCGHTFCYSCLSHWFSTKKDEKSCPDCRTAIFQCPAPAYLIREMTQIFVQRQALLPTGETIEQHEQWRKEEADIVQQDKNNQDPRHGGLFKGAFNRPTRPGTILQPIRDEEDGVDRCPVCTYELEDGECAECGLVFNEDGEAQWPDGFAGFSDMDETSEHDMTTDDMVSEMDMDDGSLGSHFPDGASDYDDDWAYPDQFMDHPDHMMHNFNDEHAMAVSRWLTGARNGPSGRRRSAFHSAAYGRNRPYTPSIGSHMPTEDTEMGTLEEEDEEELDDEDSSMNSFIDDEVEDQEPSSSPSQSSSVAPVNPRPRRSRVVESESSSMSQEATEEEEDDDDDDEGPVRPGRRRGQNQIRDQGQARRRRHIIPSDTSADDDEENQALLAERGWARLGNGVDEEMTEDGFESEGGRTTVGWEPITNSNDRFRTGGSLTPTADRPFPPPRSSARTGNIRILDGSRGLRRRSSILSTTSTVHYEDGEADDDDSDAENMDRQGHPHVRNPALRNRNSRLRMRSTTPAQEAARSMNRGLNVNGSFDIDEDDLSDGQQPRTRPRREYDPRISLIFAQHLTDMRDRQVHDPFGQLDQLAQFRSGTPLRAGTPLRMGTPMRTMTPLSRPRPASRNRQVAQQMPGPPTSPNATAMPPFPPPTPGPTRLRTPVDRHSFPSSSAPAAASGASVNAPGEAVTPQGSDAVLPNPDRSSNATTDSGPQSPRAGTGAFGRSATFPSMHSMPSAIVPPSTVDIIDRPISRVASRPPSAASRRGSGAFSPAYPAFPVYPGLNLNFAARSMPNPASRNPYFIRPRQSSQRLREQPSTATLRPSDSRGTLRAQPSQANFRDGSGRSPHVRTQSSRMNIRPMPSQQRLNSQSSTRTLRAGDAPTSPQQPTVAAQTNDVNASPVRPSRARWANISQEEARLRGAELVRRRQQELSAQDLRTNPFASHGRTASSTSGRSSTGSITPSTSASTSSGVGSGAAPTAHPVPTTSLAQSAAIPSSGLPTASGNISQANHPGVPHQGVPRRRSIRSMAAPPGVFVPLSPGMSGGYVRPRSGHMPGVAYEMPLNANLSRGVNPMVAGGEGQRL